jgi:hypothetical protein
VAKINMQDQRTGEQPGKQLFHAVNFDRLDEARVIGANEQNSQCGIDFKDFGLAGLGAFSATLELHKPAADGLFLSAP